jgi:hypothetical protein
MRLFVQAVGHILNGRVVSESVHYPLDGKEGLLRNLELEPHAGIETDDECTVLRAVAHRVPVPPVKRVRFCHITWINTMVMPLTRCEVL